MKKELLLLIVLLLATSSIGFAQHTCDLMLAPEGDNICMLEKRTNVFSSFKACRGNTVSYRAHSSSAIGYEWNVTGGVYQLNSDNTICEVTWGEGSNGMVTVQAVMPDSSVCTSQIQIILEDKPVAGVISMPNYIVNVNDPEEKQIEVCAGDTLSFVDNSTSGELPIVDYYWEYPYGVSNNRSISFVARDPGSYLIIHRVYNECGCYDEVLIKLIVRDECPLKLSCFGTVCAYSQHSYTIETPNCSDYLWNVEGGTVVSPQHSPDVTVQWDAPESGYGMLYLDGSSCECECRSRKSIRVPVISDNMVINGPDTLCLNEQYTFAVPLWGATQYTWSVSPDTGIFMSADNNSLTLTPYQQRSYTISITYSCDFLGCGPYTVTKVIETKERLDIDATPSNQEVCIGSNLTFSTNTTATSLWTVERNDSIMHSIAAPSFTYTFDTGGIYVVRAKNTGYCNEAMTTIIVKDNPPAPSDISGPDTICPGFTAEYSATPSSPNYYLLWEWEQDGITHTYAGDKVNITFGQTVADINVYQVDRRTGCRSEATVHPVARFQLADWPYRDRIRICQGQTITLSNLRDQSDNDVLYKWEVEPAYTLSIQGSHLSPEVTLLANYSANLPTTARLILKRTYCHTSRYDIAYVNIGEIDPPSITHGPICMGQNASFSVVDIDDADKEACYWYLDNDPDNPVNGMPVSLAFSDTDPHVVHLHYVSKYGCETEAADTVVACPPLPDMHVEANGNTLSVVISGDSTGYSYHWMTGETTSSIIVDSLTVNYQCVLTSPECGCARMLSHNQSSSVGCVFVDSAFRIVNHCDNIISIVPLNEYGLNYPIVVHLTQGDTYRLDTVMEPDQRLLVPNAGAYAIMVYWNSGGSCYYSTASDTISTAINIQLQNDCQGNLIVSVQRSNSDEVPITATVSDFMNGANVGSVTGTNIVSVVIPNQGWYNVRVLFDDPDCFIDTLILFDAPPTIQNIDIERVLCENTPFRHVADATGEGLTYEWNFDDGSWNYGNGIDHVYGSQGGHTVTLTITDRNHCSNSEDFTITIITNDLITYMITNTTPPCPESPAYIETDAGQNQYSWSPCNQFTDHQAYVHEAGTYIVDITSNEGHCRQQLEINVAYPNDPFAAILCDSTYCFGDVATLIGDVGSEYTYQWYVLSAHTRDSSNNSSLDFPIIDTGSHQVILRVTDSNGCTSSDTAYFYVYPTPPAPSLAFCTNPCITDGPVELCSSSGQSLLWSNGTMGTTTLYFTDGPAQAYYFDPVTGCKSSSATIQIPEAPVFDGLLTGCYCIAEDDLPTLLPLHSLGSPYTLPWEWYQDYNNIIDNGTIPPSPSMLKIPSSGEYQLVIPNYGLGCQAVSPGLMIESESCKTYIDPNATPAVFGYVAKMECIQNGCELKYLITVSICNGTDEPVCIDNIHPTSPITYAVTSGIPITLSPGECLDVTIIMQYDFSSPYSFVFVMSCGDEAVGSFVVSLSDWRDCILPDSCQINVTPSFAIDTTLSEPYQSAFFNFTLTFPSLSDTVLSVECDQGQIIDGSYAGYTFSGLLMMDYGLMSQMVVDNATFCFHIVCCNNGKVCVNTICIPYSLFWEMCEMLEDSNQSKGKNNPQKELPIEGNKAFVLVPNPTSGWVEVMVQKASDSDEEIKSIEVFSMNGQKVIMTDSSNRFDMSRLSSGTYIVKVVSTSERLVYLKLIKQ